MAQLTPSGEQTLAQKNLVTHTRVYINDQLIDNLLGYQINRSRKLGAAKLSMTVANPGGMYSYKKQIARGHDPLFGYGNKIKLQEGLEVNGNVEWFTRFTGIIVSQSPANAGGKASLSVSALDNMKMLLDFVPDDLYYTPTVTKVEKEILQPVDNSGMYFKSSSNKLPWVDIPYPVFYADDKKQEGNYSIDLINGEVYFGEPMQSLFWYARSEAVNGTSYTLPVKIPANPMLKRFFKAVVTSVKAGPHGPVEQTEIVELQDDVHVPFTYSGNIITFTKDPFADLLDGYNEARQEYRQYLGKTIGVLVNQGKTVKADYWYYSDQTNLAEDIITDLAVRSGFSPGQVILEPTGVSLKPIQFTSLTIKNGFEAMQKVKQQLPPNYIITCDVDGNLRGYFGSQSVVSDYELKLIKNIQGPISEESLYSGIIAHGLDPNPNDLAKKAAARILLTSSGSCKVAGTANAAINKNIHDQISWRWQQKNNNTPPKFPKDLLLITLAEAKKLEEINILIGDYNGGSIQQSLSVQVSEDEVNWFYPGQSARGMQGASSQWLTISGDELLKRSIKAIKIIAEAGFNWVDTHTRMKGGVFGIGAKAKTTNYYNWFLGIKEVQIWEENSLKLTSTIGNAFGKGDGLRKEFYIPNVPLVDGSVTLYQDSVLIPTLQYSINYNSGKILFNTAPTGILTANYTMHTKQQSVTERFYTDRYGANVTVVDPPGMLVFTGGNIGKNTKLHKLLQKIGVKKTALPVDNYLNSHATLQKRGEDMLKELSRLADTIDVEIVYRPDLDICQTVDVTDDLLGITERYFIEEVTESKQGYKPSVNIKMSNYSL